MRKKTYRYTASTVAIDRMGTRALMDMLRYDGARVLSNPPEGTYLFESDTPPSAGRWASFGVKITGRDS